MQSNEKILLGLLAGVLVVAGLFYGIPMVGNSYSSRNDEIASLELAIAKKNATQRQLVKDKAKLASLEEQSLCRDPDLAQAQYKTWLIQTVKNDLKFRDVTVSSLQMQKSGEEYLQHTFKVTGKGSLKQLTEFLYQFYQANYLHRIRQLSIQPIKPDNRQLLLTFSVDAVGLQSAPVDKQLSKEKASVLAHAELDKYLVPIVERSLFTPGNDSAPRFSRRGTEETILLNESKNFKLSAFDDQGIASYEIVKHDLPEGEATIDWDKAGNVTIMSKKPGTYTLEVRATDNGSPAKTSEIAKVSIRIREPAPVREPEPEAPKFDFAKTAFFIASVEVGGQAEAWVQRRESGTTLKLRVGDVVDIGSIKGKIVSITLKKMELAEGNERMIVEAGKALSSASFVVQKTATE